MPFREGQEVRVTTLLEPKRWEHHETEWARPPAIGDIGLVVDVDASRGRMIYTVQCSDSLGREHWTTEFEEEELEPAPV